MHRLTLGSEWHALRSVWVPTMMKFNALAFPISLLTIGLVACPAPTPDGNEEIGDATTGSTAGTDDPTTGDGDGDTSSTSAGDGDGDGDTSSTDAGDSETSGDGDAIDACGFSPSTVDWPLPQEFVGADVYEQINDYSSCDGGGQYRHQLLDITGDGAVDFLVTDACDETGVGTDHWEVFVNTGEGFAASSIDWALPDFDVSGTDRFEQLADYWGCINGETLRYQVIDMTGDGAVDLLVTDACDASGAGSTRWDVYANTGSGFAAAPMPWGLPQYVDGVERYEQTTDYWGCDNGETFRYQLVDMTGDGAVDLLVTDACDAAGAGATHWLVHPNTGTGFANGTIEWALPQTFEGNYELYEQTTDSWPCDGENYRYQLLDMTGDAAVDFLITDSCDAEGVGTTMWQVLENTGSGFAGQPIEWALPVVGAEVYEQVADSVACNGETFHFQTLDLTGDGAPDLVVTDGCDTAGVGTERWDVFTNLGTSFAAQPMSWPLPQEVAGTDLYEKLDDYWGCNDGETFRYSVFDINGDGAPDLTATDLCDPAGTGTTHWSVFAAVACE